MVGFIITRHVVSELTNQYWNESYRTIRKFYPTEMIMIIDDNSNKEFIKVDDDIHLYNCFIIQSEFPKAGEFLPYYYYLKYKLFDKAVILHDSVFFRKWIDFENATDKCLPIWHFNHSLSDNPVQETELLKLLNHSEELVKHYQQRHLWKACFGSQAIVAHDFLCLLEEKYQFTNLLPAITDREKRSQFERIIGCLFAIENTNLVVKPSMFGVIYNYIQWGIPYNVYQEQQGTILNQDLIKVWTER